MNRDPEIHGLLDEIDGLLAQMPREQRLTEFERMLKPRNTDFIYENEGVHYVVRTHFHGDRREDLRSKVRRLMAGSLRFAALSAPSGLAGRPSLLCLQRSAFPAWAGRRSEAALGPWPWRRFVCS